MPISTDDSRNSPPVLATSREPKVTKAPGKPGSVGDQALMDAILLIVVCWVVLFLLVFSLRSSNI